jgi:hypothetical protein
MNIYILTSDRGIKIVEGLQYCVNKYWKPNPNVILLGYKEPMFELDSNFTFVSLGEDRGAGKVGADIINYFSKISDKYFIFSVDDFFPIREVNVDILNNLINVMIDENISRISLVDQLSDKPHFIIKTTEDYNIIEMGQKSPYRKSAVWSMWNKDYFLKYFTEASNLWSWELDEKCKNDKHRVLGTENKYILQACHLYKRGNLQSNWYKDSQSSDTMLAEDRSIVSDIIHR